MSNAIRDRNQEHQKPSLISRLSTRDLSNTTSVTNAENSTASTANGDAKNLAETPPPWSPSNDARYESSYDNQWWTESIFKSAFDQPLPTYAAPAVDDQRKEHRADADGQHFTWTRMALIANETTFHGIRDLYFASNVYTRVFWILTFFIMCSTMFYQLGSVAIAYSLGATGSTIGPHVPRHLPTITVCPVRWSNLSTYRTLDYYFVSNLTDEDIRDLDLYISGYFLYGPLAVGAATGSSAVTTARLAKFMLLAEMLLATYNHSLLNFSLAHAYKSEEIFRKFSFHPTRAVFETRRFLAHGGVCHSLVNINGEINPLYIETSVYAIELNFTETSPIEQFYVLTGGLETHGANGRVQDALVSGKLHNIKIKAHRTVVHSKPRNPCMRDTTYADYQGCVFRHVNANCDPCHFYLSATPTLPEETYQGNICHYIKQGMACNYSFDTIPAHCLPPCDQEVYEINVVGNTKSPTQFTWLYISLENFHLNMLYREYPLYTVPTFASSVGGIISLYCGASFISFIQIAYLLWNGRLGVNGNRQIAVDSH